MQSGWAIVTALGSSRSSGRDTHLIYFYKLSTTTDVNEVPHSNTGKLWLFLPGSLEEAQAKF